MKKRKLTVIASCARTIIEIFMSVQKLRMAASPKMTDVARAYSNQRFPLGTHRTHIVVAKLARFVRRIGPHEIERDALVTLRNRARLLERDRDA